MEVQRVRGRQLTGAMLEHARVLLTYAQLLMQVHDNARGGGGLAGVGIAREGPRAQPGQPLGRGPWAERRRLAAAAQRRLAAEEGADAGARLRGALCQPCKRDAQSLRADEHVTTRDPGGLLQRKALGTCWSVLRPVCMLSELWPAVHLMTGEHDGG